MFGEAFDSAAFTGRVAAFKKHHHPLAAIFDPGLHFQQLNLEGTFAALVVLAIHPFGVRVVLFPAGDLMPVAANEDSIVVVKLDYRHAHHAVQ